LVLKAFGTSLEESAPASFHCSPGAGEMLKSLFDLDLPLDEL
jgi:hypothetical protein